MLKRCQHVMISSAAHGAAEAEVLHTEEPATLPSISGAPDVDLVRAIMAERNITEVTLFGHLHSGKQVSFIGTRNSAGEWTDLQHQPLTVRETEQPRAAARTRKAKP
jgi:hypothetical protein